MWGHKLIQIIQIMLERALAPFAIHNNGLGAAASYWH
jgi:hypothetical protein